MENQTLSKQTVAFGLSLALCSVINALLVVVKEKSHAVQAAMQKLTGNHWVTHAVIVLALFFLSGWGLTLANGGQGIAMPVNPLIKTIFAAIIIAGLIISGFYLTAG